MAHYHGDESKIISLGKINVEVFYTKEFDSGLQDHRQFVMLLSSVARLLQTPHAEILEFIKRRQIDLDFVRIGTTGMARALALPKLVAVICQRVSEGDQTAAIIMASFSEIFLADYFSTYHLNVDTRQIEQQLDERLTDKGYYNTLLPDVIRTWYDRRNNYDDEDERMIVYCRTAIWHKLTGEFITEENFEITQDYLAAQRVFVNSMKLGSAPLTALKETLENIS